MGRFGRKLYYAAVVLMIGAGFGAGPAWAAPPPGLLGKSTVLRWAEDWMVRPVGTVAFRSFTQTVTFTTYVSTAGRIFSRQQRAGSGSNVRRLAGRSSTAEHVPGGGLATGVKMGRTDFRGNQMIYSVRYESGARQIVVTFTAGFSSCSADVIHGREGGQRQKLHSDVTGEWVEVGSVKVREVQCSVSEGPAF